MPETIAPLRCSLAARLREVLTRDPISEKDPAALSAFAIVTQLLENKIRRSPHRQGQFYDDLRLGAGAYIWTMKKLARQTNGRSREEVIAQVLDVLREAKVSPHRFGKVLSEAEGTDPLTISHFMQEAKKQQQSSLPHLRQVPRTLDALPVAA